MVGVVGHPLPVGAEPQVAAKDTKVGASPWQGSTWQMAASFQSIFLFFACFFSPISGEMSPTKKQRRIFLQQHCLF